MVGAGGQMIRNQGSVYDFMNPETNRSTKYPGDNMMQGGNNQQRNRGGINMDALTSNTNTSYVPYMQNNMDNKHNNPSGITKKKYAANFSSYVKKALNNMANSSIENNNTLIFGELLDSFKKDKFTTIKTSLLHKLGQPNPEEHNNSISSYGRIDMAQ